MVAEALVVSDFFWFSRLLKGPKSSIWMKRELLITVVLFGVFEPKCAIQNVML